MTAWMHHALLSPTAALLIVDNPIHKTIDNFNPQATCIAITTQTRPHDQRATAPSWASPRFPTAGEQH